MGKKSTKTKASKQYTFEDLNKSLGEISPLGSTMDVSTFSEITEYIDIGSKILNLAMTGTVFGGIPNNRAVELMGPSGCVQKNQKIKIYKVKSKSNGRITKHNKLEK